MDAESRGVCVSNSDSVYGIGYMDKTDSGTEGIIVVEDDSYGAPVFIGMGLEFGEIDSILYATAISSMIV